MNRTAATTKAWKLNFSTVNIRLFKLYRDIKDSKEKNSKPCSQIPLINRNYKKRDTGEDKRETTEQKWWDNKEQHWIMTTKASTIQSIIFYNLPPCVSSKTYQEACLCPAVISITTICTCVCVCVYWIVYACTYIREQRSAENKEGSLAQ